MSRCFTLEFDIEGTCEKAIDQDGNEYEDDGRKHEVIDGKIVDIVTFTMVRTNPHCWWVRIGRRWVCLPLPH